MKRTTAAVRRLCLCLLLVLMTALFAACDTGSTTPPDKATTASYDFTIHYIVDDEIYYIENIYGNASVALPPDPFKTGTTFEGWYYDEGSWERPFSPDYPAQVRPSDELAVRVYAKWSERLTWRVLFDTRLGHAPGQTVIDGEYATRPVDPESPGYTFCGWYTDEACTEPWVADAAPVTSDIIVFAKWEAITYTATYMVGDQVIGTAPFTLDTGLIPPAEPPARPNYTAAWDHVTPVAEDMTIRAVYTPIAYSITYEGTEDATHDNPATATIEDTVTLTPAERAGYTFLAWHFNGTLVTELTGVTADITLTAQWERLPITITYEGVEAWEHNNPTPLTAQMGIVPLAPATRDGYDFRGWFLDKAGQTPITELDGANLADEVTLYARWEARTYTITYENIDGVDPSELPTSYTVSENAIKLPTLSRDDRDFAGWSINGSQQPVASISAGTFGDITLSPVWTAKSYHITYEGLRPSDQNNNPATYTAEQGNILLTDAVRNGYGFLGWYLDGELLTAIPAGTTGDLTVTAKWDLLTYTVTYENVEAGEVSGNPDTYTVESDTITLREPTRAGYTFTGWYMGDRRVTEIAPGTVGDLVLTARWSAKAYAITYLGMEGAENPNPPSYTAEDGTVDLAPAMRPGYTFMGWTQNGATVTSIPAGTTGDITLTASWKVIVYTITYENTLSADISALPTTYTVASDTISLAPLTVPGVTFKGWTQDGTTVTSIPAGTTGNITLRAEWKANTYTITYQDVFASEHKNPATYNMANGALTLAPAERKGYTFLGWTQGGKPIEEIAVSTTGNLVLTATWKITVYTITYENTKGVDTSAFPKTYTVESDTIRLPANLAVEDYTFNGWKRADGTTIAAIPKGSTGDLVLTAAFTTIPFDVLLHPMGGVLSVDHKTVWYDEHFDLPVPTREGYIFTGWYTNTGNTSEHEAVQLTDANGHSLAPYAYRTDRILYAHYTPIRVTVTFVTGGGSAVESAVYDYGTCFNPDEHKTVVVGDVFFGGWQTADGTLYTDRTPLTADTTLVAQWLFGKPISTAEDLLAIADDPTGTYCLTNDISLGGETLPYIPEFSGFLDGQGHKIKNFTMSNTDNATFALFGTNKGTIRDLTLSSFSYTVSYSKSTHVNLGVLSAINEGTIESCTIEDALIRIHTQSHSVNASLHWGSIAGVNSGIVRDCLSTMDVEWIATSSEGSKYAKRSVYVHAGGIVGLNKAVASIENCKVFGTFSLNIQGYYYYCNGYDAYSSTLYAYFGGIVGRNYGAITSSYADNALIVTKAGTLTYLYMGGLAATNDGNITASSAENSVSGGGANLTCVGGLVGYNATTGIIANTRASGNVQQVFAGGSVGGFVGENYGKIMNSYALGHVKSASGASVGGFVGMNNTGGTITQSFCTGEVVKASGASGRFVGTYAGSAVAFKCYFLNSGTLLSGGVFQDVATEHGGTVVGLSYSELCGDELLVYQLEWNAEDWIILLDEPPVQEWELRIGHSYTEHVIEPSCDTIGFTVYTCTHCNRYFLGNYVAPWGHSYEDEGVVYEPTCEMVGYTSRLCTYCDHEERTDVQSILEHVRGESVEYRVATCTEDGCDKYLCTLCEKVQTIVLPAEGHVDIITKQAVAPSCRRNEQTGLIETTFGSTAEHTCFVCAEVIIPAEVIEPHQFTITPSKAPTCTENGFGTYTCTLPGCGHSEDKEIPATGHTDLNYDGCCDVKTCSIFIGRENVIFYDIDSVEDLLIINRNPSGAYRLVCDIDLANVPFTPLCSENAPFTGYFDGNGYSILNLKITEQAVGGLFSYNKGIIRNLAITNLTLVTDTLDGISGGIAGYNMGNISGCQVRGSINFATTFSHHCTEYRAQTFTRLVRFGGLVGANEGAGIVCDSKITGNISFYALNELTTEMPTQIFSFLYRYDSIHVKSTLNVSLGMIAGSNSGHLLRCTVSPTTVMYDGGNSGDRTTHTRGYIELWMNYYAGTFAADDHGVIEDCIGDISTIHRETFERGKDDNGHTFRIEFHLQRYFNGDKVALFPSVKEP